jgi:hypothetical protein
MARRGSYGTQILPILPVPTSANSTNPLIANRVSVIQQLNNWAIAQQNTTLAKEQTKTVYISGKDSGDIGRAVESADGTSTQPYTVEIPAGIFTDEITMKPYVNLKGKGHQNTTIKATSVTNGLINIGTGCNNSTIEFEGITFHLTPDEKSIIKSSATGLKLRFHNCRFLNDVTTGSPIVYAYENTVLAGNEVAFDTCTFEGVDILGGAKISIFKESIYNIGTSDVIYLKNCKLKKAIVGNFGQSQTTSSGTCYITNCEYTQTAQIATGPIIVCYTGNKIYVEGGRWGNPTAQVTPFYIYGTGAYLKAAGCHLIGSGAGSPGVNLIELTTGQIDIDNCDVLGGKRAVNVSGGTAYLRNSRFSRDTANGTYDIYNGGGTVYVENCVYSTSYGTITPIVTKQGTLANRPATAPVGTVYYSSDEGKLYYYS